MNAWQVALVVFAVVAGLRTVSIVYGHAKLSREGRDALQVENDMLRATLAKGDGDCVHCLLPAKDIAKCRSGFPGCSRMDDIFAVPLTQVEVNMENEARERSKAQAALLVAMAALTRIEAAGSDAPLVARAAITEVAAIIDEKFDIPDLETAGAGKEVKFG